MTNPYCELHDAAHHTWLHDELAKLREERSKDKVEITSLRVVVDKLRKDYDRDYRILHAENVRADRAEAKLTRLREALTTLVRWLDEAEQDYPRQIVIGCESPGAKMFRDTLKETK